MIGAWAPTFQEGNHSNKALVRGVTLPFRNNDRISRVRADVLGVGVKNDDFRKVTVKI